MTPATSILRGRPRPASHMNTTEKMGWVATRIELASAVVRSSPSTKLI